MSKLVSYWNTFWFAKKDTKLLCILRVIFGGLLVVRLRLDPYLGSLFNWEFFHSQFDDPSKYFLDGHHMPIRGFDLLPIPSIEVFQTLEGILFVGAILFFVGLGTRVVGPLVALLFFYLYFGVSEFLYYHHTLNMAIVLAVLGCSRCNDYYSLDAYLRGGSKTSPPRMVYPVRLLQIFVTIVYLFSSVSKLLAGWHTGEYVMLMHQGGIFDMPPAELILQFTPYWLLGVAVIILQGYMVFALWVPKLRKSGIVAGVVLHGGIMVMTYVATFTFQMWALYLIFFGPYKTERIFSDD